MLLRSNKESRAFFFFFKVDPAQLQKGGQINVWLEVAPDIGVKIRTVQPKFGRMATVSTVDAETHNGNGSASTKAGAKSRLTPDLSRVGFWIGD